MRVPVLLVTLVASLIFISSCQPYQVIPLTKADPKKLKDRPLIYALPKTLLRIEINTEKHIWKAGPLAIWSDKYLGISGMPKSDSVWFRLSDVKVSTFNEADSSQLFLITERNHSFSKRFIFNQQGILQGVNLKKQPIFDTEKPNAWYQQKHEGSSGSAIWAPTSTEKEKVDTTFKTIRTDSSFYRIPVLKKQIVQKTDEDKAAEIARQIQEIREEKISILLGENNRFPDGKALSVIVDELTRLEAEYLSLFIGYQSTVSENFLFEAEPQTGRITEQIPIFCFSEQLGILPASEPGDVYFLRLTNQNAFGKLQSLRLAQDSLLKPKNGFYYRMPETAQLIISNSKTKLCDLRLPISQYGQLMVLPRNTLNNKRSAIEFFPSGAVYLIR